jgi:hypothetical protein
MDTSFQREALGSFAAMEGPDVDGDGMPDGWEQENGVDDPNGDPDLDLGVNLVEYLLGTDPHNSDTDGGGEGDYSEAVYGRDPLDPGDDEIAAPDFFHAAPDDGAVQLTYDFKDEEYVDMWLFRATSPDGPWDLITTALPSDGFYSDDTADNDMTYYYRLFAREEEVLGSAVLDLPARASEALQSYHLSAVLDSGEVMPSTDPWPPQAFVVINGGETSTSVPDVILTFEPYEYEEGDPPLSETFEDITEMKISNDPAFVGASWEAFEQGVPWTLGGPPNALNYVYVKFRDDNANESVGTEVGVILYEQYTTYLPMILKNH